MVELITVLSVIGIMSAIAFPSLMKWVPNYRLKAAAQQMYSDVQKARMAAIKTNRNVTLNLTPPGTCPGGNYSFTYVNKAGNTETVASGRMANGVCLEAESLDGLQFQPTGLLNGFIGGTVLLSNTAVTKTYTITQAWTGRTKIE